MANKPIFFDASGRRAARFSVLGWTVAILSTLLGIGFIASVWIEAPVAALHLPGFVAGSPPELVKKAILPGRLSGAMRLAEQARARRREAARERRLRRRSAARTLPAILNPPSGRPISIGAYVNWDNGASYEALRRALPKLDWVMPTWLVLNGPKLDFKITLDPKALDYIRTHKPGTAILPLLQNVTLGKWDGAGLQKLLADPVRRTALVDDTVSFLAAHRLQGVTIDFENVPEAAQKNLATFLSQLSAAFAPRNWIIVQAAPFDDDSWPFAVYGDIVDYTMLMAYDENIITDPPGPIAGQSWYEKELEKRMRVLSPGSTIVAIGGYAREWTAGRAGSEQDFQSAMAEARDSGAHIMFDDATNNPHFSYEESDGDKHDVWFLDGATAFNEIHAADGYHPAGYAMWRLGTEDPSLYSVMGRRYNAPAPDTLKHIPTNEDVTFDGNGEVLRVVADPQAGLRSLDIDADTGDIDDETYVSLPTSYVIRRVGLVPHEIALTFDDGPDAEWTPPILDILKQKHVTATFFIIGANAESNPGLVQRILADGHEIGNHTYTHPNLIDTPPRAVSLELNATQRLFEALTGRSMRLFRPPYLGDAEPQDADEIVSVEMAQSLGYITVGTQVDPLDWQRPPVDLMLKRVMKQITNPDPEFRGNIILLHDSGGDRSQTVALLPVLIDRLRAQGYRFVPVSTLAGFTRDQTMPRLPGTVMLFADRLVFLTLSYVGRFLYACFIGAIVLGIGRLLLLCGLGLVSRWKEMHRSAPPSRPDILVSVVIPAYNEEKVIAATIGRILAGDYHAIEVVVVDDGSKDATAEVIRARFKDDKRVLLLSIPNGGKANALNAGLRNAHGEVVVALDADTQFNPDTIAKLVRWFADPGIGAVAGNAKVGNRINMVTRWQALEYIVAQNLERRALGALDAFTVVPGAVGAWRRTVLTQLGGFPTDTLAEDQDLTIAVQAAGYRVHFDSSAVAWTEAPASFAGLAKQRFRWSYGTLQCLWKYRRMTFNPRYGALGLVALPQVWLFQILLTALAPVADLLLVWQLVGQWISYVQHGDEFTNSDLATVGIYYGIFVAVDLLAAAIGFLMEKREQWSLLWWLMLQRFGYRQLLYYVVVRSISTALRGPFVGWGTLERAGTVQAGRNYTG